MKTWPSRLCFLGFNFPTCSVNGEGGPDDLWRLYSWPLGAPEACLSGSWAPSALVLKVPWAYLQKRLVMTSPKQLVIGRVWELQNRQAQVEVVPCASALIVKDPKEQPGDTKKQNQRQQKTLKITFDETMSIAWKMRPLSLARELSGTIQKILGTTQPPGLQCHCHRPHDVMDDRSGAECLAG